MNLSLKLLLDMAEPGSIKKALSSAIGRGCTIAASAKNRVPKGSEVGPRDAVSTEELCDQ